MVFKGLKKLQLFFPSALKQEKGNRSTDCPKTKLTPNIPLVKIVWNVTLLSWDRAGRRKGMRQRGTLWVNLLSQESHPCPGSRWDSLWLSHNFCFLPDDPSAAVGPWRHWLNSPKRPPELLLGPKAQRHEKQYP